MRSRRKKAAAFNPADLAKASPYVHRLVEDAELRDRVQTAIESARSAYERATSGKGTPKALLEDKKLQGDLRTALESIRDVSTALTEAPRRQARKGRRFGRKVMILGLGAGLALVASEDLRSKVLDTLFGAEEEFEYTPPASAEPAQDAPPVTAA